MVEVLALHLLLVGLAMVEVIEVADNDGHRQCNGQHTGNGAQRAHDLAPHADRPARWRCCCSYLSVLDGVGAEGGRGVGLTK